MEISQDLLQIAKSSGFRISTDTRQDVKGTLFFALKGATFDGGTFVAKALEQGALAVVTENKLVTGDNIFIVDDVLKTLQNLAAAYRETLPLPIIAIGGSNGKTTTRELVYSVLEKKFRVHSSKGNLNNHIGLPLSVLATPQDAEITVFEIGANHPGEHLLLLEILRPTHVLVTNNGLDHLEGFGSPEGVRKANAEIYEWARAHGAHAFVNQGHTDLLADSEALERSIYRVGAPVETQLIGNYNFENIYAALAVGEYFGVSSTEALEAVASYRSTNNRSQSLEKDGNTLILDCYNANPSSMTLALQSFVESAKSPRGVILGDMLELGGYAQAEHEKIVAWLMQNKFDVVVLIGENFKQALEKVKTDYVWFSDSTKARDWFKARNFTGFTFLLKGSRGTRVEQVVEK